MQFLKMPHFGPKTAKKWFSGHISGTVPPRTKILGVLRPSGIGLIGQAIKKFCPQDLAATFAKIIGAVHLKTWQGQCETNVKRISSNTTKVIQYKYFILLVGLCKGCY